MASTPQQGDRLTAKVDLTVYTDAACNKIWPPVPPGLGYKTKWQYPAQRKTGQEVGTYTGVSNETSYQVDFVIDYRNTIKSPPVSIFRLEKGYVKRNQVTGNWDTGVDAPKIAPPPPTTEPDNTNLFLMLGIGAAVAWKYFKN